jgi:hypothetical protein
MAYSCEIADLLAVQLTKLATLNVHQLAGQVANLDFWLSEVCHCQTVIDEYNRRFESLYTAQTMYVKVHGMVEYEGADPEFGTPTKAPHRIPHHELNKARRNLSQAAHRFLDRCYGEGLLSPEELQEASKRIDGEVDERDRR